VLVIMALSLLVMLHSGCSVMYNHSMQQRLRTERVFDLATKDGEFRATVEQ